MQKPTVYIESTVVSYFTARENMDIIASAHQEITIEWWKKALPKLHPYISQFVIDEIEKGDSDAAIRRISAIKDFEILEVTPQIVTLANTYFSALDIPEKARTDSFHIALAVFHGLDYFVTWNCTHIAAGRVRLIIDKINNDFGTFHPLYVLQKN